MSTTYPTTHATIDHVPAAEVRAHERTYHRFLELVRYAVLAHLVAGSFIVLAFFAGAGWGSALVVAAVILAAGLYLNRRLDVGGPAVQAANLFMTTVEEEGHAEPVSEQVVERPRRTRAAPSVAAQADMTPDERSPYALWIVAALFVIAAAAWLSLSIPTLATMIGYAFS